MLPASEGGDGYVCCGATKSWLLPAVPQRLAPAVQINVTAGHVRSAPSYDHRYLVITPTVGHVRPVYLDRTHHP